MRKVMLWTYKSSLMPADWRAWDCLDFSRDGLEKKCMERYGRVSIDLSPVLVHENDIPDRAFNEKSVVLSQLVYRQHDTEICYAQD